ncbi:hypothetical protein V8C43DRAFT_302864 [Trichoderma afarasin]
MNSLKDRVIRLFERLKASRILLVEWETTLWIRLGNRDLAWNGSLFLLVPDRQFQQVLHLAIDTGLSPADEDTLPSIYPCETLRCAVRFLINESPFTEGQPRRRLVFLPMFWTGITRGEIVPRSTDADSKEYYPPLPSSIQTVPLSVAVAALCRIANRENGPSRLRMGVLETISGLTSGGRRQE